MGTCATSWRESLAAKHVEQQRALAQAEEASRTSLAAGQVPLTDFNQHIHLQ